MTSNLFNTGVIKADRVVRQIIRSSARDANGYKLDPAGVDLGRYNANPVVLYEHTAEIIGRAVRIEKRADLLIADLEYLPEGMSAIADEVYNLDKAGFMPGSSIGYREITYAPVADGFDISKWELFEISKVHIPADRLALRTE